MKAIFITADGVQSAPQEVPGGQTGSVNPGPARETIYRLVMGSHRDYQFSPAIADEDILRHYESPARRYRLDQYQHVFIDGVQQMCAVYREVE